MKTAFALMLVFISLTYSSTVQAGQSEAAYVESAQAPANLDDETGNSSQMSEQSDILIAYFTRLDNTEATLDEIIQGGGPYGSLGNAFENAQVDAIASASITVVDGQAQGNVETMAQMIQSTVGGDLFSIQTVQSYPVDYNALIDLGGEEKATAARPELATHVENMAIYEVIFLGYPNWWYDMPMAVYSFLEEYDLSGKTVIPFTASAGSGFSGTIDSIRALQPQANIVDNGLHIAMGNVAGGMAEIESWIRELEIF